jgi:hypothetical protein
MTTNNDMAAQLASLQALVADLKLQCDGVHAKLGWPTWAIEKRQRADNQKAAGSKVPFDPGNFVYRPKPHEVKQ